MSQGDEAFEPFAIEERDDKRNLVILEEKAVLFRNARVFVFNINHPGTFSQESDE